MKITYTYIFFKWGEHIESCKKRGDCVYTRLCMLKRKRPKGQRQWESHNRARQPLPVCHGSESHSRVGQPLPSPHEREVSHSHDVGRHTCFSLEAMGPRGVVTWIYKPLLKLSCFFHTHLIYPSVQAHGILPSGNGRLTAWGEFCYELIKLTLSSWVSCFLYLVMPLGISLLHCSWCWYLVSLVLLSSAL